MPLPLPRSAGSLLPVRQPTLDVSDIYVRYVLLVHSSFLILITRFATLEGMKIKSVTPMHHLDDHGSPAAAGGGLAGGGGGDPDQGL
jgi:hypothetical protein